MKGLRLPLVESGRVDGNTGSGRSAPSVCPVSVGVLVNQRGRVSLWSFDLKALRWARSVPGWGTGPLVHESKAMVGPTGGSVWSFDVQSGEVVAKVPYERVGELVAADSQRLLVRGGGFLTALNWDGQVIWKRETLPTHVRLREESVLITEKLDRLLVCLKAGTGDELWRFEAPEGQGDVGRRSQIIPPGFPSVTVVGDRVIVLTMGFRIFILSLETGEVLAQTKPPFPGSYVVTETSIFFKQAFGLSEFNHRELKEVDRIEYRAEIEPLYKGNQTTVNAFCLSEESVIWTTMHGALMGVSRRPGPDGKRVTWCQEIPGAIMPLAEAPVVYGDYLYFTKKGENPELLCFRSNCAAA